MSIFIPANRTPLHVFYFLVANTGYFLPYGRFCEIDLELYDLEYLHDVIESFMSYLEIEGWQLVEKTGRKGGFTLIKAGKMLIPIVSGKGETNYVST